MYYNYRSILTIITIIKYGLEQVLDILLVGEGHNGHGPETLSTTRQYLQYVTTCIQVLIPCISLDTCN